MSKIVHREVLELRATPEQVRRFIMTPERILDYYPMPVGGSVLEAGHAITCRGQGGVSLLERIEPECDDSKVVIKVTTAIGLEPPDTRERIEAGATFSMIEDWELVPSADGTTLTKTWRDIVELGAAPFPLEDGVRQGASGESGALIDGWNRAAAQE